jgi:hypothetical protein
MQETGTRDFSVFKGALTNNFRVKMIDTPAAGPIRVGKNSTNLFAVVKKQKISLLSNKTYLLFLTNKESLKLLNHLCIIWTHSCFMKNHVKFRSSLS